MLGAFSQHVKHPELEQVHREIKQAIAVVLEKHEGNPYMGVDCDNLPAMMANAAMMPLVANVDAIAQYQANTEEE